VLLRHAKPWIVYLFPPLRARCRFNSGLQWRASTLTGIFIERLWGFFDRRLKGAAACFIHLEKYSFV